VECARTQRRYPSLRFVKARYLHQYVRVRAARPALVALIGVAAVLLAATPALAATGVNLRLSTSHGTAGESVTATLSYPDSWGWSGPSCDGPVTFRWDGRSVAQTRPGWKSGSCTASVTITPPSSASGSHVVRGSAPNVGSAETTYTIDPAPAPAASPPPPPSTPAPVRIASTAPSAQPSRAGRSVQPSQSAGPTPSAGSPSPSAAAAPRPWGSATPGDPATLVAMDAPEVIVRPAVSTPLWVWVLMAGGALVLLGAALVGAGRLSRRKRRVAFSI
jgi:hypothetical protein